MNKSFTVSKMIEGYIKKEYWIVDDITDQHSYIDKQPEALLVRVQRFGRLHSAMQLLVDKKLIEPEFLTIKHDDDLSSNNIAYGRAFLLFRDTFDSYYKNQQNQKTMQCIDDLQLAGIRRERSFEDIISIRKKHLETDIGYNKIEAFITKINQNDKIKVHVFKVGQGDTIILEFADDTYWIIDAYLTKKQSREYFYNFINSELSGYKFENLILTHLHYDHIKDAHAVITKLNPRNVIYADPPAKLTYTAIKTLECALQKSNLVKIDTIKQLKNSAVKLIPTSLLKSKADLADPNAHGVIVAINTSKSQFILSGDIHGDQLEEITRTYFVPNLQKDKYYKVSHHCSISGYNNKFLQRYNPSHSVTSCGLGNRYGHPHNPPLADINLISNHQITYKTLNKISYTI